MEMKRRIGFIEKGTEFLKLKRDHLAKELTSSIDVLKGRRNKLLEELQVAYRGVTAAYISLGPTEVTSQASSLKSGLEIEVLPRATMGVRYPFIKVDKDPQIAGELDITLNEAAEKVMGILKDIIQIAEFEARAERIADELERPTGR
jgi:vacuolar-type H+-ATPase subunit D/Vma8